ncbi:MAG TPA: 50S ribosomal protein L32 [Candidatus Paceibacterota bacterium]|nr:50S ribosomal protein L32 [Candidatus Paceibacterota bacterium]HRZ29515.1 50S ribosomal protein L32 [Candidatus Paceibacterota bacterium]
MALPARHHSKSRTNKRRSHHALTKVNLVSCPKCKEKVLANCVCPNCGTYKGKMIVDVLKGLDKKEKKAKQKELKSSSKETKDKDSK